MTHLEMIRGEKGKGGDRASKPEEITWTGLETRGVLIASLQQNIFGGEHCNSYNPSSTCNNMSTRIHGVSQPKRIVDFKGHRSSTKYTRVPSSHGKGLVRYEGEKSRFLFVSNAYVRSHVLLGKV